VAKEKMRLIAMRALTRVQPPVISGDDDSERVSARIRGANEHVDVASVSATGSFHVVKRSILRVSQLFLRRQAAFNHEILEAVSELNHLVHILRQELMGVHSEVEHARRTLAAERTTASLRLDDVESQVSDRLGDVDSRIAASTVDAVDKYQAALARHSDQLRAFVESRTDEADSGRIAQMDLRLSDMTTGQRELEVQLRLLRDDLGRLLGDIRRTGLAPSAESVASIDSGLDPTFELTYERFEEAFRGAEAEIEKRLSGYVHDVEHLADGELRVLDLGSGRGEWLRLLKRHAIPATGVDTSARFANQAVADGLEVDIVDALTALANRPPGSLGAVTAFQLVEHLEISEVRRLLDLILTALAPGGVLILETPNPTNLRVGAGAFYRDPTHRRPVHPDLLGFLVAETGFVGVETRFLNPAPEYDDLRYLDDIDGARMTRHHLDDLRWALYGPQDYAVLARKPGTSII
jgi:SAM-dependent methyltransferase